MVLKGALDRADWTAVHGWAHDPERPGEPVPLELVDNGAVVARFRADQHRPDLEQAGFGSGHCAFRVTLPQGWSALGRHVLAVRSAADGTELRGSPVVLEPAGRPVAETRAALMESLRTLAATGTPEERTAILRFLVAQTDAALRARTDGQPSAVADAFYARWRDLLPNSAPSPAAPRRTPIPAARIRPRVLALAETLPDPAARSGLMARLRGFQALGAELALAPSAPDADPARVAALEAMGIACHVAPLAASTEEVLRRHAGLFDTVLLDGVAIALRYGAMAREHMKRARLLLDAHPLASIALARQAEIEQRPELATESRQARAREAVAAWSANAVLVSSAAEAEALRESVPGLDVHVLPAIAFQGDGSAGFDGRKGVVLPGDGWELAEQDAAEFLVRAVMPIVWASQKTLPCLLAGANPPERVRGLAGGLVSLVEADVTARLFAAPFRITAGLRPAVADYLAHGLPGVLTSAAAEGLDLPASLLADDPAAFAAAILRLHARAKPWQEASRAGQEAVARLATDPAPLRRLAGFGAEKP